MYHRLSTPASNPIRMAGQIDSRTWLRVFIGASDVKLILYVITSRCGEAPQRADGFDGERKST